MIAPIAQVLGDVLRFFYHLTGSWGWAIVLLTVAVKLVLHPLTRKQLKSMKIMQALAPQIEVLKRKYGKDPRQFNIEVMNLYRANKANPLGGCLPMLLQLPILWALFALLREPLFYDAMSFWIVIEKGYSAQLAEDLCATARICSGFAGLSLATSPTLDVIRRFPLYALVPILAGLTTFIQQQMSITDPQQARMFVFMPIIFAWFSLQFPTGLSVYWIVSTVVYMVEYLSVVGRPKRVGVAPPRGRRARMRLRRQDESRTAP
ncbi:MAG: YidC/Oxa1 family membrane protein insertase [Armatimonadota bacterium]|nr:YidC/Oxa1 family membrane protein insertase [Armatimonadota bacterium]